MRWHAGPSQGLKIQGARTTLVGIIWPPGWDRVNCSAINWGLKPSQPPLALTWITDETWRKLPLFLHDALHCCIVSQCVHLEIHFSNFSIAYNYSAKSFKKTVQRSETVFVDRNLWKTNRYMIVISLTRILHSDRDTLWIRMQMTK